MQVVPFDFEVEGSDSSMGAKVLRNNEHIFSVRCDRVNVSYSIRQAVPILTILYFSISKKNFLR